MGRTWYSGSWDLWLLKSGSTSSHFIPLLPDIPQAVGEHCQYAQEGCWQGRWHCLGTLATLRTMLGGSSHGSYLGSVSGVSSPTYKCWITQSLGDLRSPGLWKVGWSSKWGPNAGGPCGKPRLPRHSGLGSSRKPGDGACERGGSGLEPRGG